MAAQLNANWSRVSPHLHTFTTHTRLVEAPAVTCNAECREEDDWLTLTVAGRCF